MRNKAKIYLVDTSKVLLVTSLVILIAFGIVFQPKWTWYSMLTGSFLAVFLLSMAFFASAEELSFRLGNSSFLGIVGAFLSLWGWLIRYMSNSVIQTIRQKTKKERNAKNRSTPLGM